ncbi:glycerophosphodiester phosphodiesterase [Dactylosporangium sp. NPDC049525]|uniref:glycerophosphodiester phosphodiesterase n=1 Tax=Dactylosporangium sp. NPDC049525 TaxID=3154730 RepID=UPI003448ED92
MRRRAVISGISVAAGAAVLPQTLVSPAYAHDSRPPKPARPLVIGHRGASGHRPEHTLASYRLAIALGADFIEPDLVPTKDGQLVARHENEISGTTNVASRPQFAARQTTKTIDGVAVTGWFTEDFTLAELKTLRAVERLPAVRPHNTIYDGLFEIPTLQEVIDLARSAGVGIYPETKHPTYFTSIGLALEPLLARVLKRNGLAGRNAHVFLQSFEPTSIKKLRGLVDTPSVVLLDAVGAPFDFRSSGDPRTWADLATPAGLDYLKAFTNGVGATKNLVIARDAAGNLLQPTALIRDAHARGLKVHSWTFRNENQFLPLNLRKGTDPNAWGDVIGEIRTFLAAGLDGVFADYPDTAVLARDL